MIYFSYFKKNSISVPFLFKNQVMTILSTQQKKVQVRTRKLNDHVSSTCYTIDVYNFSVTCWDCLVCIYYFLVNVFILC